VSTAALHRTTVFSGHIRRTRALTPSTLCIVAASGIYRTDLGLIFRVTETIEGGLKVEILQDGVWVPGRIGMVGLRLAPSTTKLGRSAVDQLPA